MNDPMLPLPGLSLVAGKTVVAKFDGGLLSSNAGVLALHEVEQRLRVADRFAACIKDPRAPDQRLQPHPCSVRQHRSSSHQEEQNVRNHNRFKREQALAVGGSSYICSSSLL